MGLDFCNVSAQDKVMKNKCSGFCILNLNFLVAQILEKSKVGSVPLHPIEQPDF